MAEGEGRGAVIWEWLKSGRERRTRRQHLNNFLVIVLAGLIVFNIRSFWWGMANALGGYTDFSALYTGAAVVKNRLGGQLYSYELQKRIQQELFSEAEFRTGPLLYNHPAFETLVFLPLAYFPYPTAYLLWLAVNVLILLAVPILLLRYLGNLRPTFHVAIILSFFAFFPIFTAAYHGQDSIVLLLLFTLAFVSLKKGRPLRAGVFLGLGLFKFQLVAPFLLLFLVKRQWQLIKGFSLTALLLAAGSVAITGREGVVKYAGLLWSMNQNLTDRAQQQHYAMYPTTMPNLRGFLNSFFAAHIDDSQVLIVTSLFSLVVLLWFYSSIRERSEVGAGLLDLEFSMNVCVTLLVSFHLNLHDVSLLMLPILLVSNHIAGCPTPRGVPMWTLRVTMLLLLMTPVYVTLILMDAIGVVFLFLLALTVLLSAEFAGLRRTHGTLAPSSA